MKTESYHNRVYGIVAEFADTDKLIAGTEKAKDAGYTRMDAYTPYPVEGLDDLMGFREPFLPWLAFFGGIFGAVAGFGLQYWTSVIDYPMNVGGKPDNSWQAFLPVTVETTILFAALAVILGMLLFNGFPYPWHPIFNAPDFDRVSTDRFFLCIESRDPLFDLEETRLLLESADALHVSEVYDESEPIENEDIVPARSEI
jgi:hypothetical protein